MISLKGHAVILNNIQLSRRSGFGYPADSVIKLVFLTSNSETSVYLCKEGLKVVSGASTIIFISWIIWRTRAVQWLLNELLSIDGPYARTVTVRRKNVRE